MPVAGQTGGLKAVAATGSMIDDEGGSRKHRIDLELSGCASGALPRLILCRISGQRWCLTAQAPSRTIDGGARTDEKQESDARWSRTSCRYIPRLRYMLMAAPRQKRPAPARWPTQSPRSPHSQERLPNPAIRPAAGTEQHHTEDPEAQESLAEEDTGERCRVPNTSPMSREHDLLQTVVP